MNVVSVVVSLFSLHYSSLFLLLVIGATKDTDLQKSGSSTACRFHKITHDAAYYYLVFFVVQELLFIGKNEKSTHIDFVSAFKSFRLFLCNQHQ